MEPQNQFVSITKGKSLWWVASDNAKTQCAVTVTKVGRKWATLSNGCRIDIGTLVADGGQYMSPGMCYDSQQAYEQAIALIVEWQKLTRDLSGMRCPEHMTIEKIARARALLHL